MGPAPLPAAPSRPLPSLPSLPSELRSGRGRALPALLLCAEAEHNNALRGRAPFASPHPFTHTGGGPVCE